MRESLVGFGHAVGVFLFLHGAAAAVEGIQKLGGELVGNSPGNADALRQGLQCYAVSRGGGRPGCLGVFPLRPSRCGGAWTRTHGMTL